MGVENIMAGDGIGIAITGMGVVFGGLVLVSLYVALLPRVFEWAGRARRAAGRAGATARDATPGPRARVAARRPGAEEGEADAALLAAIGYVIQAERERQLALDHQRITLRDDDEQRVWTAIGKMRTLSTRM